MFLTLQWEGSSSRSSILRTFTLFFYCFCGRRMCVMSWHARPLFRSRLDNMATQPQTLLKNDNNENDGSQGCYSDLKMNLTACQFHPGWVRNEKPERWVNSKQPTQQIVPASCEPHPELLSHMVKPPMPMGENCLFRKKFKCLTKWKFTKKKNLNRKLATFSDTTASFILIYCGEKNKYYSSDINQGYL